MRKFESVTSAPADTKLPTRSSKHSAGYDFYLNEDVIIPPHSVSVNIKTGIKAQMEEWEFLGLYIRSSLAIKKNLLLVNGVGIIDSDYYNNTDNEGEIRAVLLNVGGETVTLSRGERFMQGIFQSYSTTNKDENVTKRSGGLGSSGV